MKKKHNKTSSLGNPFPLVGDYFTGFYENNLPFELTNAQKRVLKEIRNDMKLPVQMNRLLQGDVGSGKQWWLYYLCLSHWITVFRVV